MARPLAALVLLMTTWLCAEGARAQEQAPRPRKATFAWDASRTELRVSFGYRDVVDSTIRKKLSRGLPTTIVLTGTLYDSATNKAVSTTAQTCKITWHVWNEAYRIEITRPEGSRTGWTTTLEGVLRRCAEARRLLAASSEQIEPGAPVRLEANVQVNPVSQEVLKKIKRWVSRPLRTGTAAPGDALFSTFTGLFMRRIGEAERKMELVTPATVPEVERKRGRGEG